MLVSTRIQGVCHALLCSSALKLPSAFCRSTSGWRTPGVFPALVSTTVPPPTTSVAAPPHSRTSGSRQQVFTRLFSVSAYSGTPSDGKEGTHKLGLPVRCRIPTGDDGSWEVEVDTFQSSQEVETGRKLMNDVIVEGKAWPFEPTFETEESFRAYFLSHSAFVVREAATNSILGCFYVKPNFPGRCSHICNGGFIVDEAARGNRVGTLMGACFLKFAKDLGYTAAYFNLVFESNHVSIKLWERLGFECVAVIPKAARLEGMPVDEETGKPELDTAFGYYYDLEKLPVDFDPLSKLGPYKK